MKGNKMNVYDTITNYDITIKDNELYLVINGKEIKLVDNEKYLKEIN
tara:strand:+ start:26404 stop:26544 length:141 start_codon:yes stop_codon:yes gene_type:complete